MSVMDPPSPATPAAEAPLIRCKASLALQDHLGLFGVARATWRRLLRTPTEDQILGYTRAAVELTVQRQLIYLSVLILSVAYYDALFGASFYFLNVACDVAELRWARRIQATGRVPRERLSRDHATVLIFTTLSSVAISLFVVGTTVFEEMGDHFTPLFFLLAAAIFATMNNHQVPLALVIRVAIYGATFLYVPWRDLARADASLGSPLWLHLFTAIFVLFFILDCARVFLSLHRESTRQLAALRTAEAQARAALVAQTQFLSVVSHELRTPLTSINGALSLAASGRLGVAPDPVADVLSVAARNGRRLAALVNDILDVQKLSAGQMVFHKDRIDLDDLVDECVEANACLSEEVRLVRLPREGALSQITADHHRLLQVMTNIVSNAIKFSPKGGTVELGTFRRDGVVGVWVRDHGRGIPLDSEDKVFGQFKQVDSSDQREKQGTGLGMNIARQIMDAVGGEIHYRSRLGMGTTFFLEFPDRLASPSGTRPRDTARVWPAKRIRTGMGEVR